MTHAENLPVEEQSEFKRALLSSILFHFLIVIVSMIGMPFIAKPPSNLTPINIEIVAIDKKTQTNVPPKSNPAPLTRPKPAAKNTAEEVPDLTKEKPPEIKPEKVEPTETVPLPEAEKPKEKPKPKPEKTVKPKPQPKVEEKKNDFDSLLKNLAPDTPDEQVKKTPDVVEEGETTPNVELGEALTVSELDAFRRQIEPCWNVPSGAKYAENLVVEIRVYMNPDATLKSAKVLDQFRYNSDTAYRAAADSAVRALRNPMCSPLRLPLDKYESWKTIVIRFDPRDML